MTTLKVYLWLALLVQLFWSAVAYIAIVPLHVSVAIATSLIIIAVISSPMTFVVLCVCHNAGEMSRREESGEWLHK